MALTPSPRRGVISGATSTKVLVLLLTLALLFNVFLLLLQHSSYSESLEIDLRRNTRELDSLYTRNRELEEYVSFLETIDNGVLPESELINGRKRPLRVIFFTTMRAYQVMMDRNFYHFYAAAHEHPLVEAHLWGPGFENWDDGEDYVTNIERKYGSKDYFQIALLWGDVHNTWVTALSQYTVIAYRFEECWEFRCAMAIENFNITLVMFNYPDEMEVYRNISYRRVYIHSPHTGSKHYFLPKPPYPKRDITVLSIGAVSPAYPLRTRLRQMIEDGKIPGAVVRKHPGYTNIYTEEELKEKGINVEWHERQVKDYAQQLQRAKITIVTSSIYKYSLQKYPETALAGSLLIGNIPADRDFEYKQYLVEIDPTWDDQQINDTINYWLTHEEERLKKTKLAQDLTLRKYTYKNTVDTLIKAYNLYSSQQYGMYYQYPFSVGCKATRIGLHTNNYCTSTPING